MRRNLLVSLGVVTVFFLLLIISCRKINMATDVGQGLIPEVDNIHTFDTVVEVQTYNHLFTALNDTFNTLASDEQFLGLINDPIFGKTDARMFFQVLRNTKLQNIPSKRYLDSIVLYVDYLETYGDTTLPQTIQVSEIPASYNFKYITYRDSSGAYSIRNNTIPVSNILASKIIIPSTLKDSVSIWQDSLIKTGKVLRIKLDNSLGQRLLSLDSASTVNDTLFKQKFNGLALQSIFGGNAAMGFNLLSAKTRLSLYYRYDNLTTANDLDTTVADFTIVNTKTPGTANYIGRDYSGTAIAATAGDNVADQFAYVQNTPGTYTLLKIPALANMSNRIVHLAQLQAESIHDPSDTLFYAPKLFIDAVDNAGKNFSLPYVFNEFMGNNGVINDLGLLYFGSFPDYKTFSGNVIKNWNFNLTRYVQNIVNKKVPSYDLRLYAKPTFTIKDTVVYKSADNNFVKTPVVLTIPLYQSKAAKLISPLVGRVRLGGGSHPTQKMKMRIVYSKI